LRFSSTIVNVPLSVNPQMINPADASLQLQAAVKNVTANVVFYFVIPFDFDAVLTSNSIDVNGFASAWKSLDESNEASVVIKGMPFFPPFSFSF
jgi:hypothetical protein